TPDHATLTRANGTQKQARDPDALVELVLGSPLPVAGLRDWLRGQTGRRSVQKLEKNKAGQPAHFVQNGWQVELSRYDALGPRLLQLNHNHADRRISVRLVIDSD
ncbi:MAG: outer membrane lipoprotein LolB, partial [Burkholderiaceae bacterium]